MTPAPAGPHTPARQSRGPARWPAAAPWPEGSRGSALPRVATGAHPHEGPGNRSTERGGGELSWSVEEPPVSPSPRTRSQACWSHSPTTTPGRSPGSRRLLSPAAGNVSRSGGLHLAALCRVGRQRSGSRLSPPRLLPSPNCSRQQLGLILRQGEGLGGPWDQPLAAAL